MDESEQTPGLPGETAPPGEEEPAISIKGLRKAFGSLVVLDGFDLDVAQGETFTVLGPSGSGKSTLLKQIIGLLKPDTGSITVAGRDVVRASHQEMVEIRQGIGLVFQYAALLQSLSVYENVALPLVETRGMTFKQAMPIVDEKLELVGLGGFGRYLPAQLSGGMRKRVGVARAIVHEPEIMLYDEPTTGLDPVICRQVDDLIISMREKLGVTSIVISHDVDGAYRISDRMGILFRGKLCAVGTPEEIRRTDHPAARQLLDALPDGPLNEGWRPADEQ